MTRITESRRPTRDGTFFFWVTRGSLLIEAEIIGLENGQMLRIPFMAWSSREVLKRAPP